MRTATKKNIIHILICTWVGFAIITLFNYDPNQLESNFLLTLCLFFAMFVIHSLIKNQTAYLKSKIKTGKNFKSKPYEKPSKFFIFMATFIALTTSVGTRAFQNSTVFGELLSSFSIFAFFVFQTVGLTIFYYYLLLAFNNLTADKFTETYIVNKPNNKLLLKIWLGIFLAWIPYNIGLYPARLSYDSTHQFLMAMEIIPLTSGHPPATTLFMKPLLLLTYKITNDYTISIYVYIILQQIIMSLIFAYTIFWIKNNNNNKLVSLFSFAYYAFFPLHAFYSMTMWKDVIFAGGIIILSLSIFDIIKSIIYPKFRNEKPLSKYILFIIGLLIVMLFRHNGKYIGYVIIPIMIGVLITKKTFDKKLFISLLVSIIVFTSFNSIVNKIYQFEKNTGSIYSSLSIPIQQIVRVVSLDGDYNQDEADFIDEIGGIENFKDTFDPFLSDRSYGLVVPRLNEDNIGDFFKVWLQLLIKNPAIYLDAFIYQTRGYWYIVSTERSSVVVGYTGLARERSLDISLDLRMASEENIFNRVVYKLYNVSRLPGPSILWGAGFTMILIVFFAFRAFKNNQLIFIIPFLVPILLWLSVLASVPLDGATHYIYGIYAALPLSVGMGCIRLNNLVKKPKN